MARKGGTHKGLEPYVCADGKTRWRVRIADPTGRIIRYPGLYPTIKLAQTALDHLRVSKYLPETIADVALARTRTIDEEIEFLLKDKAGTPSAYDDRVMARWWKAYFRAQRVCLLREIRATHLAEARLVLKTGYWRAYGTNRKWTVRSDARVNRYTDWGRHWLNTAKRQGRFVGDNPFYAITRYRENPAPLHRYSEAQEARLSAELGPYADWLRVAILSNMRQGNQFTLEKHWIQWDDGLVQLPKTKNGRPRFVVMSAELRTLLRTLCAQAPQTRWVFPGVTQRGPMNAGYFRKKIFAPACRRAGLPHELTWHTLRHTFGSRLAEAGWSAKQIKDTGGWADIRAAERYIHFTQGHLRDVAESLSRKKKATDQASGM